MQNASILYFAYPKHHELPLTCKVVYTAPRLILLFLVDNSETIVHSGWNISAFQSQHDEAIEMISVSKTKRSALYHFTVHIEFEYVQ